MEEMEEDETLKMVGTTAVDPCGLEGCQPRRGCSFAPLLWGLSLRIADHLFPKSCVRPSRVSHLYPATYDTADNDSSVLGRGVCRFKSDAELVKFVLHTPLVLGHIRWGLANLSMAVFTLTEKRAEAGLLQGFIGPFESVHLDLFYRPQNFRPIQSFKVHQLLANHFAVELALLLLLTGWLYRRSGAETPLFIGLCLRLLGQLCRCFIVTFFNQSQLSSPLSSQHSFLKLYEDDEIEIVYHSSYVADSLDAIQTQTEDKLSPWSRSLAHAARNRPWRKLTFAEVGPTMRSSARVGFLGSSTGWGADFAEFCHIGHLSLREFPLGVSGFFSNGKNLSVAKPPYAGQRLQALYVAERRRLERQTAASLSLRCPRNHSPKTSLNIHQIQLLFIATAGGAALAGLVLAVELATVHFCAMRDSAFLPFSARA